jgi:hypothetical protein
MNKRQIDEILGDTSVKLPGAKITIDEGLEGIMDIVESARTARHEERQEARKEYLKTVEVKPKKTLNAQRKDDDEVKLPREGTISERVYNFYSENTTKSRESLISEIMNMLECKRNLASVKLLKAKKRYEIINKG